MNRLLRLVTLIGGVNAVAYAVSESGDRVFFGALGALLLGAFVWLTEPS